MMTASAIPCTSGFPPVWLPVGNNILRAKYRRVT